MPARSSVIRHCSGTARPSRCEGCPCAPSTARSGAVWLPPGGRADVFGDTRTPTATLLHAGKEPHPTGTLPISGYIERPPPPLPPPPLPSNGLPAQLDLKNALR